MIGMFLTEHSNADGHNSLPVESNGVAERCLGSFEKRFQKACSSPG